MTPPFQAAVAKHHEGDFAAAKILYRQTLQEDPSHVEARHLLGILESETGNHDVAVSLLRQAVGLNPANATYHSNLGLALQRQSNLSAAAASFREALRVNPTYINALFNLAKVLSELGQYAEASDCYRQALQINPDDAPAHFNLGSVYLKQDRFADAVECFRKALAIKADYADAQNNMGLALSGQQDFAGAAESYRRAFAIEPKHSSALWNLSLLQLLQGDLQAGWPNHEHRWAQPGCVKRSFSEPLWDGTPLNGRSILLHAERGLGDTIQFIRYARMVKERGGRVIVECQPALTNLLAGTAGIDQVVPQGQTLPAFDLQIPLMSLGNVFQTTLTTIPSEIPYLQPGRKRREYWREEIRRAAPRKPAGDDALRIGVVWKGNPNQPVDRHRSVSLVQFAPLAQLPNVRLLSLQVGPGRTQLDRVSFPIIDLGSRFSSESLDDLAAVLCNLDLVVTVCTSVAHLAGALGVPGIVALTLVPYWCWHLERDVSPWYPTLRLFRQKRLGEWPDVFERIAKAIGASRDTAPLGSANRG